MFYSYEILQRKRGKFGVIWLAATAGKTMLTRREYANVNVSRTCHDIEDYLFVRVAAPPHKGSRPRFSLYLSSQLMYGTVKVYHKQVDFLMSDAINFSSVLRVKEIDLKKPPKTDMTMQDPMTTGLHDLDFGLEDLDLPLDDLPPPVEMFQPMRKGRTPERPRKGVRSPKVPTPEREEPHELPTEPSFRPGSELGSPYTRTSEEMQIPQEVSAQPADRLEPISEDLPPLDTDVINFMNGIPSADVLYHPEPEEQEKPVEKTMETEELPEEQKTPPLVRTEEEQPAEPPQPPAPEPKPAKRPAVEEDETPRSPKKKKKKRSPKKAVKSLDFPDSPLPPVEPREQPLRRPRRKRHSKLIIDEEKQISRQTIRDNMEEYDDIMRVEPLTIPKEQSCKDLMTMPSRPLVNQLLRLWKRNLMTKSMPTEMDQVEYRTWMPSAASGGETSSEGRVTDGGRVMDEGRVADEGRVTDERRVADEGRREERVDESMIGLLSPIPTEPLEQAPQEDLTEMESMLGHDAPSMEIPRQKVSEQQSLQDVSEALNLEDVSGLIGQSLADSREDSLRDTLASKKRGRRSPTQQLPDVPEAAPPEVDQPSVEVVPDVPEPVEREVESPKSTKKSSSSRSSKSERSDRSPIEMDSWSPIEPEDGAARLVRLRKEKKRFRRFVAALLTWKHDITTFRDICPPRTSSRSTAARFFSFLLADASAPNVKLLLVQNEPYADIIIKQGPQYDYEELESSATE